MPWCPVCKNEYREGIVGLRLHEQDPGVTHGHHTEYDEKNKHRSHNAAHQRASAAQEQAVRRKEAERILKYIREDAYVITLEIQGREYDSESFAGELERLATQGVSTQPLLILRHGLPVEFLFYFACRNDCDLHSWCPCVTPGSCS